MKILLIQPAKAPLTIGGDDVYLYEPLALEYIASGVVDNHDVKIHDIRLEKNIKKVFDEFKPDVVGITAYTVNVNIVKALFKEIKAWNPEVFTVIGGHHATVAPDDFLDSSIDLSIMGEGVFAFQELMRRLEKKEKFDGMKGIVYKEEDNIIKIPHEPVVDLDALPLPKRDLTKQYRSSYASEWMKPLASMRTSKGCAFRCNFCALWKLTGGRYLTRKPENIVKELLTIKEEFIFFADDESLIDAKRMTELARLIKEAGIKKRYFLYGRSDTVSKHPELIEAWKEVGLERVFVGLEFFSDEDLKYIKKGSTIKHNREAVTILQSLGIEIYASFIVRPDFTKEDFRNFIDYCRSMKLNFATFAVLTPLPGTDLYQEVKEIMITHNYDYFDFLHTLLPTKLSLKEFYEELYNLYKKSVPFSNWISFMRKFPLRDIPAVIRLSNKIFSQIRNAYKDYEGRL
ncbi:MAG: B12-binding domain-containing radical SAM protein [Nitrospirota bacterium]|nr:B12-binding domain-containing radical SAM protein [Nitrospirota bacterium]MDH5768862.1 B12-binding domain-containing radical SAM protein [Nitrospirota bacterium]